MAAQSYAMRADAIQEIAVRLRRRLELASASTISDKMSAIDTGVEIVNKILYTFLVSQDLFNVVENDLNNAYRALKPVPRCIDRVFAKLVSIVLRLEAAAREWVSRYRKS